jgi:hypothetical protein
MGAKNVAACEFFQGWGGLAWNIFSSISFIVWYVAHPPTCPACALLLFIVF